MSLNPALLVRTKNRFADFGSAALLAMALSAAAPVSQARTNTSPLPGYSQIGVSQYCPPKADPNKEAIEILKQPPFTPTNVNLLRADKYGGVPAAPAADTGIEPTLDDMKKALATTFTSRFGRGSKASSALNQAVAFIQDPSVIEKVPDVRLRAAAASQIGTLGEGILQPIQDGTYKKVEFAASPDMFPTELSGARVINNENRELVLLANPKFQHENINLMGVVFSHEMNHQDYDTDNLSTSKVNTGREELVSYTIQNLDYAKLLLEQPQLATANTLLTQDFNTQLMGLLNTRTADGRVNLQESTAPIYPGSIDGKDTPYFAYGFEQAFPLGPDST